MKEIKAKMLDRLKTYLAITVLAASAAAALPVHAAPKGWEPVKTEKSDAKQVAKDTDLEIKTSSGIIIVNANHPVQIKVFTILGRLVNSETLSAGKSQLQLPAHGVYIVKVGDLTCKVAV
ncbi:MAG: T9SS type A sorting domain-containing protein [Muribaculaceae bacterium]|nr:T9SS type A sorting domain-containing protein [Muribaculaceae bacterium]